MELPVYKIVVNDDDETGVDFVSLVDRPAIQKDFMLFNEQFVEPGASESEDEFISRCIPYMIGEGMEQEQAAAVCYSKWESRQKFESYDDYPEAAKENAKVALRWAEENGWGDCGTAVGKIRANQLANGEAITRETIARMAGFERHRQNSQKELGDGCGRLMWLAWGGDEGIEWASRKLQQIDNSAFSKKLSDAELYAGLSDFYGDAFTKASKEVQDEMIKSYRDAERQTELEIEKAGGVEKWYTSGKGRTMNYAVQSEEKRIVTGPAMLADLPIYRYDDIRGEYYVTFDADTIWKIAKKFVRNDAYKAVNTDHANPVKEGVHMIESYFIDRKRGVMPPTGYEDAKDGSWFLTYLIDNEEIWAKVKDGEWKGFSVEGLFDMEEQDEVLEMMREITAMLKNFA